MSVSKEGHFSFLRHSRTFFSPPLSIPLSLISSTVLAFSMVTNFWHLVGIIGHSFKASRDTSVSSCSGLAKCCKNNQSRPNHSSEKTPTGKGSCSDTPLILSGKTSGINEASELAVRCNNTRGVSFSSSSPSSFFPSSLSFSPFFLSSFTSFVSFLHMTFRKSLTKSECTNSSARLGKRSLNWEQ